MTKLNPPPNDLKPNYQSGNPEAPLDWKVTLKDSNILDVLHQEWNLSRDLQGIMNALIERDVIPRMRSREFRKDIQLMTESLQKQGFIRESKKADMVRLVLTNKKRDA